MQKISMVDLRNQYVKIEQEIQDAIQGVLAHTVFINGPEVRAFSQNLGDYLGANHIIPCANGTDALQIALMSLELQPGDEVIIPAFNYVALAEVAALLKLKPVFVDVDPHYFTIDPQSVLQHITSKTKVIAPVHLFGQCAPMKEIKAIAQKHGLYVIEDNAQAIGSVYQWENGTKSHAGTIGDIGTTSFFPSKNLGCYGDGGAISTQSVDLFDKLKMIANHGQKIKYIHDVVGVNSRLDTLQAAILKVKLAYLDQYNDARRAVADAYDKAFAPLAPIVKTPQRAPYSTHVFHQYTLQIPAEQREDFRAYLAAKDIPTMVYYPIALHHQKAYTQQIDLPISTLLADSVVSLPISTEMTDEQVAYICEHVLGFFEL